MFKKYMSLDNSYQNKHIQRWIDIFPRLNKSLFAIEEKLHGANVSVLISDNGFRFFARNHELDENEGFYGYKEHLVKKYDTEFRILDKIRRENGYKTIRLYGEYFGSNIQKGVFYGAEKQYKVFDMYIDDVLILPYHRYNFFTRNEELSRLFHPPLDIVDGLYNALDYNTVFRSEYTPENYPSEYKNICEGIVIKPYDIEFKDNNGSHFYLKKKNEEFLERQKATKPVIQDSSLVRYRELYNEFITEQRIDTATSKLGEFNNIKQMGEFMKEILSDAEKDFFNEVEIDPEIQLNQQNISFIKGIAASKLSKMLKARLSEI